MPKIEIRETTLQRLKRLADQQLERRTDSFVDTTEDAIISKALDALETQSESQSEWRIDPSRMPSMLDTKILDATVEGISVEKLKWINVIADILRLAAKRKHTFEDMQRLVRPVNLFKGRSPNNNYKYLPDIHISQQRLDADRNTAAIISAVKTLGISLDVGFMWTDKEGVEHSGKRGRLKL